MGVLLIASSVAGVRRFSVRQLDMKSEGGAHCVSFRSESNTLPSGLCSCCASKETKRDVTRIRFAARRCRAKRPASSSPGLQGVSVPYEARFVLLATWTWQRIDGRLRPRSERRTGVAPLGRRCRASAWVSRMPANDRTGVRAGPQRNHGW